MELLKCIWALYPPPGDERVALMIRYNESRRRFQHLLDTDPKFAVAYRKAMEAEPCCAD